MGVPVEKAFQPEKTRSPLWVFCSGLLAGAGVTLVTLLITMPRRTESAPQTVQDVQVRYMYESEPNGASGSTYDASSIEFRPGYILVTDTRGGGRLFAVDRLREFSYTPLKPARLRAVNR